MGTGIKDIAREAGVSQATVSLVMNNRPGVGEVTRQRVLSLARTLGYSRGSDTSPQRPREKTILFLRVARHGHVLNDDHAVFIANYMEGLGRAARSLGLNLEIHSCGDGPIGDIVTATQAEHIGGCIILGTEMSMDEVAAFSGTNKPLVFMDTFSESLGFSFVDMNNTEAVFRIVEHLALCGHREIGIVTSNVSTPNFHLRARAFRDAMEATPGGYNKEYALVVDSTFSGAYEDMKKHLSTLQRLPTAFFCANDIMALGCIKALKEAGIAVPQDVSVVGFDNLPSSAMMDPPLTTFEVPKVQIGEYAVRLLQERILSGNTAPHARILVSGTLTERGSVRKLPQRLPPHQE